jgi:hypothetical protein
MPVHPSFVSGLGLLGTAKPRAGECAEPAPEWALAQPAGDTPASGPRLTLTSAPTTGAFIGGVVNPATGRPVSFGGVVLQGWRTGSGFILGAGGSGEVRLES